jgi:hypothetical protein
MSETGLQKQIRQWAEIYAVDKSPYSNAQNQHFHDFVNVMQSSQGLALLKWVASEGESLGERNSTREYEGGSEYIEPFEKWWSLVIEGIK